MNSQVSRIGLKPSSFSNREAHNAPIEAYSNGYGFCLSDMD